MKKVKLPLLSLVFFCLIHAAPFVFAQGDNSALGSRVISLNVEDKPVSTVLEQLINFYDVSFGLEASTVDSDETDFFYRVNLPFDSGRPASTDAGYAVKSHRITMQVKDAKLSDVLDSVVRRMDNYRWEINEGVVNFIPIRGRDKTLQELLEVKISEFKIVKNRPINQIWEDIFRLPEIKDFMATQGFSFRTNRNWIQNGKRRSPEAKTFNNLKFKELLNKICNTKKGGWILRKTYKDPSGKMYLDLDI